jgi:uncharacterized membrane protein
MSQTRILTAAAIAAALTVSAAFAQQQQQTRRLNGTIERVDGNTIYAKGRTAARSRSSLPITRRSPPC